MVSSGRASVHIDGKAHRLYSDHIDRNRDNNCLYNLRPATKAAQRANQTM
jgi:hypothetical protein